MILFTLTFRIQPQHYKSNWSLFQASVHLAVPMARLVAVPIQSLPALMKPKRASLHSLVSNWPDSGHVKGPEEEAAPLTPGSVEEEAAPLTPGSVEKEAAPPTPIRCRISYMGSHKHQGVESAKMQKKIARTHWKSGAYCIFVEHGN